MARKVLLLLAAAVLAALALAACGGDDEGGDGGMAQPGGDRTPAATQPAERTPEGDEASLLEKLRSRVAERRQQTLRIRYAMRRTFDGKEARGSFELAQKPPKALFRFELDESPDAGVQRGVFLMINDGSNTYLCFEGDGGGMCFKGEGGSEGVDVSSFPVPGLDPTLFALGDVDKVILEDPDVRLERAEGRKSARIESECWRTTSGAFKGSFCVGKDVPILTYAEGSYEDEQFALELEEFSTNVPDSLFEPPYPVRDLGGGFFPVPTPSRGN